MRLQQAAVHDSLSAFHPGVEPCQMCYSSRFQVMWLLSNYDTVQLVCATLSDDKWLDAVDRLWHPPHVLPSWWSDMGTASVGKKNSLDLWKALLVWGSPFSDCLKMICKVCQGEIWMFIWWLSEASPSATTTVVTAWVWMSLSRCSGESLLTIMNTCLSGGLLRAYWMDFLHSQHVVIVKPYI